MGHEQKCTKNVLAVTNSCSIEEYAHNEMSAHIMPLLISFGLHPQLPAVKIANNVLYNEIDIDITSETINNLAKSGKLAAIGEIGFDLFDNKYRETEKIQDYMFAAQIEIAHNFGLPVILHVRRAIHKIFVLSKILSKCKAVVFHSWSGTLEEAQSVLRRGINAYFSFGNCLTLNHKQAMRCCAYLPAERLLTETDAPYQPRRGQAFSQWADLPLIIEATAALRREAGNDVTADELETQVELNFRKVFFNKI
ncbi:MAG: TatD family hydrolase [Treponema sp.]|nr:TatD family hydrolase [Treponema sp.]